MTQVYQIIGNKVIHGVKEYEIHVFNGIRYIEMPSLKDPHGWFNVHSRKQKDGSYKCVNERQCTSERLLINWGNGCNIRCKFCYTQGMNSFLWTMKLFWETGIISVWVNYIKGLKRLFKSKSLNVASIAYISPLIDPFMEVEKKFHLTEKVIETFLQNGLPSEFITKVASNINDRVFKLLSAHKWRHSFGQFTIISDDDLILKFLAPGADNAELQWKGIRKSKDYGLYTILRLDPLFFGLTANESYIKRMFIRAKEENVDHIIISVVDIPRNYFQNNEWRGNFGRIIKHYDLDESYRELYLKENQVKSGDYNVKIADRRRIFKYCNNLSKEFQITMSLCMEFERKLGGGYIGLNEAFMTSKVCEGLQVPLYYRKSPDDLFKPMNTHPKYKSCDGNCLLYAKDRNYECKGICNIPEFQNATKITLTQYRKYSKQLKEIGKNLKSGGN